MTEEKVQENRVRRMAERQGFVLRKSRRRDPLAHDFGGYWLHDGQTGGLVFPGDVRVDLGGTLGEIERWLSDESVSREAFIQARVASNRANEMLHELRLRGIESGPEWATAVRELHLADAVLARRNYFEKITRSSLVSPAFFAIEATCEHRHGTREEAEHCEGVGNIVIERTFSGSDIGLFFVRQQSQT